MNFGDTPGVFTDATFVGLALTIPITITFESGADTNILLVTTQVEIFGGKTHPVYWDWLAGAPLPPPIGYIDDTDPIPGKPEFHLLTVPAKEATKAPHSLTILVNPDVPAGLKDDFVLKRIEADERVGMKVGW